MDEQTKESIIEFNRKFGLNTEFITDENVLGYALGNKIYINSSIKHDYERTNKHELLHFFEETEEFEKIKRELFESKKIDLNVIREEYKLRYFGLYSDEEIEAGVLDNEIAIDLMVDNSSIEYEEGLKVGDRFLGNIEQSLEEKRYLNLLLKKNIQNMNLSKWEKIFVSNFYDGKEHILPQQDRANGIRLDIESYLNELYELGEEEFIIDSNSPEIIREYESEIKALQERGENTYLLEQYKENALQELATKYSKQLYAEYKHIVDLIKGKNYEPAFKCMMLRETLTKTYKLDTEREDGKDKTKTIVKKRKPHESIAGHMVLNETTLDFIYKHSEYMEQYQNFANLYFASVEVFKQTIARESEISLDGVKTYGKGRWIKFDGKTTNEEEYLENANKLSALVQDTPWCTKTLASSQLAEGDFYVFVDNYGKPHIAVKMSGNEIDQVRGLQNGDSQELEEEFRDVAISFLMENREIQNGKEWLEKEEWNKRLIEYKRKIDSGEFTKEDMPQFIEDYFRDDYRNHGGINTNKTALEESLEKIRGIIADYYECKEEEILCRSVDFSKTDFEVVPYKVIFGDAIFFNSPIKDLGMLQSIGGTANFQSSQVANLGMLQRIGGDAEFFNSPIKDLGMLQKIGRNAYFIESEVIDLGMLQSIGGKAFFIYSQITDLGMLQSIGGDVSFQYSKVADLGMLQRIEGNAIFSNSKVTNLGMLQSIGGQAYFVDSEVTDLGMLQSIGGKVSWGEKTELEEQYKAIQEKIKKARLSGKDIGMAGFGTDVEDCDRADDFLARQIENLEERNDIQNG